MAFCGCIWTSFRGWCGMAMAVLLVLSSRTFGQDQGEGLIIRVLEGVVYIDLGERNGIARGDLFNVLSAEVLKHPLRGDTLAITSTEIGIIRVNQVFERMALAQVIQGKEGEDLMLKPIARIQDSLRRSEVENLFQKHLQPAAGKKVSKMRGLVPGLYQFRQGGPEKGLAMVGLQVTSLALGIGFRFSSNDWQDQYNHLPGGQPQEEYQFYLDKARSRRQWSNRCFWVAGVVYAFNWLDVLISRGETQPDPGLLEISLDDGGHPQVQVVYRF